MKKNKKYNKREYAYQVIRSRILEGIYVGGQRIIIDQIAKEVESSHIPVREAIHQLESEQLIEYQPNIGPIVKGIDDNDFISTLEVLALLEGYATALSAQYIDYTGIQKLTELNNQMQLYLKQYELDKIGQVNRDFHYLIYSYCPNELLIFNIKEMWERLDAVRHSGFRFFPNRTPHSIHEHETIISYLREKESPEKIEQYTRLHKLNTIEAYKRRNE